MVEVRPEALFASLRAFGADLSRWPDRPQVAAREALLARPDFRRAWESDRALDRSLAEHRETLDGEIAHSGAVARIRRRLVRASDPLAGVQWRSVAAAVLVAGMLGGAIDLALPDRSAELTDMAMLDPLDADDGIGMR